MLIFNKISLTLSVFSAFALLGCGSEDKPSPSPAQPKIVKRIHEQPVLHLSELWGASKSKVQRALHGHKLIEHDKVPKSNPDAMIAGGEIRVYNLGGDTEFTATFNSQGYATIVSVNNQKEDESGLGLNLDQWQRVFSRYGLPECGEPAKTAPIAYYWGPPHNKTGGYEIIMVANEKGRVWQVQARSPDDFFPE